VKAAPAEKAPSLKPAKYTAYDPTKTIIYVKVFWETEFMKDRLDESGRGNSSFRAQGNIDKVIGIMISHLGIVYNLLSKLPYKFIILL